MLYEIKKQSLPNGEILAYRETGSGEKTLLLIHGNQSSSLFYEFLMRDFENSAHLIAVDMAGFGNSEYKSRHMTIKEWADDIALFMTAKNIDNAIVLGWSAGGGVAMELSACYPDKVQSLVLLASVGVKGFPLPKRNRDLTPVEGEYLHKREDVVQDPAILIPVTSAIQKKDTDFLHNIWKRTIFNLHAPDENVFDAYMQEILKERCFEDISVALCQFNITHEDAITPGTGNISNICCPVTWIHGRQDMIVPFSTGEDSIRYFEGKARLFPIEEAGHAAFMDQPEIFNGILKKVLAQCI